MKKILILTAFLLCLTTATAAGPGVMEDDDYYYVRVAKRLRKEFVPQHEFRLTAGAYPVVTRHYYWSLGETLRNGPTYTSGSWTLSYDKRIRRWFDAGIALSYYGEYTAIYSNLDNSFLHRDDRHRVAVMPSVRFTWFNSTWVNLYSSLSAGIVWDNMRETIFDRHISFAGQCTPIGVSVGKSLFGFAEIGVGTQGVLMIGLGYRFNVKNK